MEATTSQEVLRQLASGLDGELYLDSGVLLLDWRTPQAKEDTLATNLA